MAVSVTAAVAVAIAVAIAVGATRFTLDARIGREISLSFTLVVLFLVLRLGLLSLRRRESATLSAASLGRVDIDREGAQGPTGGFLLVGNGGGPARASP